MRLSLRGFLELYGQPFSEMLGIEVKSGEKGEIVKWFLASILYSKPIRESSATETYKLFEEKGILTPSRILQTGWDGLVNLLDEGGYRRYDFSTADRLLQIFGNLEREYEGDLNRLHASSTDSNDLEERLRSLGKGIGDTTISIFLRDLRGVWPRADPEPSALVRLAMQELGIRDLKQYGRSKHLDIVRLETALLRLAKDFLKKGKTIKIRMK